MSNDKKFSDLPASVFYRHWMCGVDECEGEMKSTGEGFTTLSDWLHRCSGCGRKDLARENYPKVVYKTDVPK